MIALLLLLGVSGRIPADDEGLRRTRAYRVTEGDAAVDVHVTRSFRSHAFELGVRNINVDLLPSLKYFSTVPYEHEAIAPLVVSVHKDGSLLECQYQDEVCECSAGDTVVVDFIRTERAWNDANGDQIQVHRLTNSCDSLKTMLKIDARQHHQVQLNVAQSQVEQPEFPRSEATMDTIEDAMRPAYFPDVNYARVIVLRVAFTDEYGQEAQVELTAGVDVRRVLREAVLSITVEYILPGYGPDIVDEKYRVYTATVPSEEAMKAFHSEVPEWVHKALETPYAPVPVDSFPRSLPSGGNYEAGVEVGQDLCFRVRLDFENDKVFSLHGSTDLLTIFLPPYELECLDSGKRSFKIVRKDKEQ